MAKSPPTTKNTNDVVRNSRTICFACVVRTKARERRALDRLPHRVRPRHPSVSERLPSHPAPCKRLVSCRQPPIRDDRTDAKIEKLIPMTGASRQTRQTRHRPTGRPQPSRRCQRWLAGNNRQTLSRIRAKHIFRNFRTSSASSSPSGVDARGRRWRSTVGVGVWSITARDGSQAPSWWRDRTRISPSVRRELRV
jgi:hypothetical protein